MRSSLTTKKDVFLSDGGGGGGGDSKCVRKLTRAASCYPWNRICLETLTVTLVVESQLINLYAPCVLYIGQVFRYSLENTFYIFNQQIYFII